MQCGKCMRKQDVQTSLFHKLLFQNEKRGEKASEDDERSSVDDEASEDGKAKNGLCVVNSLSFNNLTNTTFFEMYLQVRIE